MPLIFNLRSLTPNIGNDLIALGMQTFLRRPLGRDVQLVTLPAARTAGVKGGGLDARTVYEINQLADGLISGRLSRRADDLLPRARRRLRPGDGTVRVRRPAAAHLSNPRARRKNLAVPRGGGRRWREAAGRFFPEVHDLVPAPFAPWGAQFLQLQVPRIASPGAPLLGEVVVRNTGRLAWPPHTGRWPSISLSIRLVDPAGRALPRELSQVPVNRWVAPGQSTRFIALWQAPASAGDYRLEWDLLCAGECWFAQCGSTAASCDLRVG